MEIKRGSIYWVPVQDDTGKKREIIHPHVVIQDTIINQSRIDTIAVCGISTNMKLIKEPGNILLEKGEANLEKQSIIVVSQISTAKKDNLGEYIGTLSEERVNQLFAGMKFIHSYQN